MTNQPVTLVTDDALPVTLVTVYALAVVAGRADKRTEE